MAHRPVPLALAAGRAGLAVVLRRTVRQLPGRATLVALRDAGNRLAHGLADAVLALLARLVGWQEARVVTAPGRRARAVDLVVVAVDDVLDEREDARTLARAETRRTEGVDLARIARHGSVLALAVGRGGKVVLAVVLRRIVRELSLRPLLVAPEDAR